MTAEDNGKHFDEGWTLRTLKQFYDQVFADLRELLLEREKRHDERAEAVKSSAIASSESLKEYKAGANEIRAALNDWQKTVTRDMVTKTELSSLEGKVFAVVDGQGKELKGSVSTLQASMDGLSKLIIALQNSEARGEGGAAAKQSSRSQSNFVIGIAITVALGLIANVVTIGLVMYKIFVSKGT